MLSFGVPCLRVSRKYNPYAVARKFARLARLDGSDAAFLRELAEKAKARPTPQPSPDLDTPEPTESSPVRDVRAA